MVCREVYQIYTRKSHPIGDVILDVDRLQSSAFPEETLSFSLRSGEIVGLAGLVGAGRTELLRTLFGIDRSLRGEIRIADKVVDIRDSRSAIAAGLALVPED